MKSSYSHKVETFRTSRPGSLSALLFLLLLGFQLGQITNQVGETGLAQPFFSITNSVATIDNLGADNDPDRDLCISLPESFLNPLNESLAERFQDSRASKIGLVPPTRAPPATS